MASSQHRIRMTDSNASANHRSRRELYREVSCALAVVVLQPRIETRKPEWLTDITGGAVRSMGRIPGRAVFLH